MATLFGTDTLADVPETEMPAAQVSRTVLLVMAVSVASAFEISSPWPPPMMLFATCGVSKRCRGG
jgi:hypothetical protein